jgi:hypothetical protein
MLIECSQCEAKVHGKVLAEREYSATEDSDAYRYVLVECPSCEQPILGLSELGLISPTEGGWTDPERVWPDPDEQLPTDVPLLVRVSLHDARKCLRAKVFTACAVMCGRALEAICKEKSGEATLAKGLKQLHSQRIIDDRLFEWGEALRKERNVGAHATDETVTRADAQDILDFATAIASYVYVMSAKFEAYQVRKAEVAARRKPSK